MSSSISICVFGGRRASDEAKGAGREREVPRKAARGQSSCPAVRLGTTGHLGNDTAKGHHGRGFFGPHRWTSGDGVLVCSARL